MDAANAEVVARGGAVTEFQRVPETFVDMYDFQFRLWAKHFQKIGKVGAIKFARPLAPMPGMKDQRRILGVRMEATVDRTPRGVVVVIKPQTQADEDAILRHVADMRLSDAR